MTVQKFFLSILLLVFAGLAHSQVVKFILSTGPGSGSDATIEIYSACFKKQGIDTVKEFKTGAEGLVAIKALQASVDTPQMINFLVGSFGLNMLSRFPGVDLLEDIHPFVYLSYNPIVLISKSSKLKTMDDLIAFGKQRPVNVAVSFGSGTYFIEKTLTALKVPYQLVPYKNHSTVMVDVMNGSVDAAMDTWAATKTLVEAGTLSLLTSTMENSYARKLGHKPMEFYNTELKNIPLGIILSSLPTLSKEKKQFIHSATMTCNKDPEVLQKLEKIHSTPSFLTTEEIRNIVKYTTSRSN